MSPIYYPQYGYQGATPNMQNRLNSLEQGQQGYQYYQPQNYQQNYQQNCRPVLKAMPVTSFDEAKAAMVDFDGSLNIFVDSQNNSIYTKQLNSNGTSDLKVYKLSSEPMPAVEYVFRKDYDNLLNEVQLLKNKLDELVESLGGKNERIDANNESSKKQ